MTCIVSFPSVSPSPTSKVVRKQRPASLFRTMTALLHSRSSIAAAAARALALMVALSLIFALPMALRAEENPHAPKVEQTSAEKKGGAESGEAAPEHHGLPKH